MVDVWTVTLLEPRRLHLSRSEAERAARFRFETDRVRWSRARSALRSILGECLNTAPDAIEFHYGENGKPHLTAEDVQFNLSHSGDFAMVAVSTGAAVGVDLERIRPDVQVARLLTRLGESDLPSGHAELYARWTLREARTKAIGGQLFTAPAEHVFAQNIAAPQGYSAAVALVGSQPTVRVRQMPG